MTVAPMMPVARRRAPSPPSVGRRPETASCAVEPSPPTSTACPTKHATTPTSRAATVTSKRPRRSGRNASSATPAAATTAPPIGNGTPSSSCSAIAPPSTSARSVAMVTTSAWAQSRTRGTRPYRSRHISGSERPVTVPSFAERYCTSMAARPAATTTQTSLVPSSAPACVFVAKFPGSTYATATTSPGPQAARTTRPARAWTARSPVTSGRSRTATAVARAFTCSPIADDGARSQCMPGRPAGTRLPGSGAGTGRGERSGDDVLDLLHEPAAGRRRAVVQRRRRREHGLGRLRRRVGHVAEGAVAVRRGAVRPAALRRVLALTEVVEGVLGLGDLVALGEVARRGQLLGPVVAQLLDRREPLVLVHPVAGEVELEHLPDARVVGQVEDPCGLQPALRLGGGVRHEVRHEVAAGDDVLAVPGLAGAVGQRRPEAGHDLVLRVGAADDRGSDRVLGGVEVGLDRSALEQSGDHGGDHLDVCELLGRRVEDQVLVLAGDPAVPPLEQVLHGHGHLAEGSAEQFLQVLGEDRVRLLGLGLELQALVVEEHSGLLGVGGRPLRPAASLPGVRDVRGEARVTGQATWRAASEASA